MKKILLIAILLLLAACDDEGAEGTVSFYWDHPINSPDPTYYNLYVEDAIINVGTNLGYENYFPETQGVICAKVSAVYSNGEEVATQEKCFENGTTIVLLD